VSEQSESGQSRPSRACSCHKSHRSAISDYFMEQFLLDGVIWMHQNHIDL